MLSKTGISTFTDQAQDRAHWQSLVKHQGLMHGSDAVRDWHHPLCTLHSPSKTFGAKAWQTKARGILA